MMLAFVYKQKVLNKIFIISFPLIYGLWVTYGKLKTPLKVNRNYNKRITIFNHSDTVPQLIKIHRYFEKFLRSFGRKRDWGNNMFVRQLSLYVVRRVALLA